MTLMQAGRVPSVTDVAEAAEVSRATAYRYFPTQAALVQAAVDEALGPILEWRSDLAEAEDRIADLLAFAYPRIDEYEATLRAALLQAMDQWSRRRAGTLRYRSARPHSGSVPGEEQHLPQERRGGRRRRNRNRNRTVRDRRILLHR